VSVDGVVAGVVGASVVGASVVGVSVVGVAGGDVRGTWTVTVLSLAAGVVVVTSWVTVVVVVPPPPVIANMIPAPTISATTTPSTIGHGELLRAGATGSPQFGQ